ncbi:unnamed protein product, partial [marine sediment metagenome]
GRFVDMTLGGRFDKVDLGGGKFAGLGTLSSGRLDIIEADKISVISKLKAKTKVKEIEIEKEKDIVRTSISPLILPKERERIAIIPAVTPKIKTRLKMAMEQSQDEIAGMGVPPVAPTTKAPIIPKPKIRTPIPFLFPGEKPRYVKEKPYTPYAYIEAKGKNPYWKQLDKRPLTKKSAQSISSRFVDEQISAHGKVVPMKVKMIKGKKVRPKKQAIDLKEDYFGTHRQKFRTWKQVKGKRTALKKGHFIELEKHRLDSPLETRGIMRGWGKRRTPFGF